jgi:hypothetical protein
MGGSGGGGHRGGAGKSGRRTGAYTEFQRSPWSLKPRFADLGLGLASKLALASIYCTKYLR